MKPGFGVNNWLSSFKRGCSTSGVNGEAQYFGDDHRVIAFIKLRRRH